MTREEAIEILRDTPIDIRSTREDDIYTLYATAQNMAIEALRKNEMHKLSNREWKEFLSEQFGISKASAKEMLHGMMAWKKEDNFKRLSNPMNNDQGGRRE